jgi:L-ascorbate metabolism protein UlaG (beta-lactamase superfamily)
MRLLTRIASVAVPVVLLLLTAAGTGCSRSMADVDPTLFPDPADNTITFWGHACFYIDVDGYGIVTDPVFQKTTDWRRRRVPAPPPSSYAHTGIILVSHGHNDHLSRNTIRTFPETATILCSRGCAKYLDDGDVPQKVIVMNIGDEFEYPGGKVVAVAAHHTGGRFGFFARDDGRALGFVVYTPQSVIYYTGDTNYWEGVEEIGAKYRPDIAIVNVNGHLHSSDAIQAILATRAPTVIPTHFGAYGYLWVGEQKVPRKYEKIENILEPVLLFLNLGESCPLSGKHEKTRKASLP